MPAARLALRARRPHGPDPQRDPRPDRRAVAGRPRIRGAGRAGRASRADPPRSSASIRTAPSSSASRSRSTRSPRPSSGSAARSSSASASIARRGHTSVEAIAADLAELAAALRSRRPHDEPLVGVGVAVVGIVRRSDGFVSNAPNLGWRDVPLGAALADALDVEVPISVANDADLGALVELRRGAAIGYQRRAVHLGRVRRRRRVDRRWRSR